MTLTVSLVVSSDQSHINAFVSGQTAASCLWVVWWLVDGADTNSLGTGAYSLLAVHV